MWKVKEVILEHFSANTTTPTARSQAQGVEAELLGRRFRAGASRYLGTNFQSKHRKITIFFLTQFWKILKELANLRPSTIRER